MATTKKKRKQGRTWPIAVGALGVGLVAALLSGLYLKSREAAIRAALEGEEVTEVTVVVASRNLPRGSVISPDNFAVRKVPEKFVHEDAVSPGQFERYQGRSIVAAIGAGKTLLKSFLDESFPVDFSDTIPKGHRAMTVTVDEVNSVAGFIRPGNRIDIYVNIPFGASGFDATILTEDLPGLIPAALADMVPQELLEQAKDLPPEVLARATPTDVIMPVLQNVSVLAAGRTPYKESLDHLRQPQQLRERTFTNVTLDLLPKQAALLASALDKGELLALLRHRDDDGGADFTTISSRDLFDNAKQMSDAEAQRKSRATVVGGVDGAGNLVDADGNRIMSRSELEAAGYRVNRNGQIVDKDGNVVDPADLVVGANGEVMSRKELAAAGLTVNASGQLVDKDGNVVSASDLVKGPDGKIYTKSQLAAAGLQVNENGEIVDASGKVVSADDLITGADGKVYTKEQLAAAGLAVNEKGEIVDAATGEVVDPASLVTLADGRVMTKAQLAEAGLTVNKNGQIVDARTGEVLTDEQATGRLDMAAAGLAYNEKGEIVDTRTGKVLSGEEAEKRMQMAAAGLTVNEKGEVVDIKTGKVLSQAEVAARLSEADGKAVVVSDGKIQIIVGGSGKDGVAKVEEMSVTE